MPPTRKATMATPDPAAEALRPADSSEATLRLHAYWTDDWDPATKVAMRELAKLGVEWEHVNEQRSRINERRKRLYLALDGVVPHRVIAAVHGTTKGAVEQALVKLRRANGA